MKLQKNSGKKNKASNRILPEKPDAKIQNKKITDKMSDARAGLQSLKPDTDGRETRKRFLED